MKTLIAIFLAVVFLAPAHVSAALIAQYNFDDNTASDSSGSATTYDLLTQGAAPSLFLEAFESDGNAANHLSIAGPGGMTDWTVSLWVRTTMIDQGAFRGIFSNNTNPNTNWSWQIDSHGGSYRLLSKTNGNSGVVLGSTAFNKWEHILVQKFGGNNARLYFNGNFVTNTGFNPGGLQNFRVGTNRNTSSAFTGFIDNIQIWDDSGVNAAAIFRNGPGINQVSAPASLLLLSLALIGLASTRTRRKA